MQRLMRNLCAIALVIGCALPATADPFFTVSGGASYVTPLESFLWVGPRFGNDEVLLWEGGVLGISELGQITVEYIGKEASFADNIFRWNGADIFSTGPGSPAIVGQTAATPFPPAALGTFSPPGDVPGGPLPFSFLITAAAREEFNDGNLAIAFWPIPADPGASPSNFGTTVYAMLDDGNVFDFDHDDMIVRLTVGPALPEPSGATIGVAAAALIGSCLRRRRSAIPHRP